MAQQTKRRRSKHRGNAAGMIEARGRTGRKPTESERKGAKGAVAARPNRFDQPPTWRGAFNRALIAIVFFVLLVILLFKQPVATSVVLAALMLLIYVPMGYYTDLWLYNRRQRQKAQGTAK
ncbi:MAG TPA: hypothetical protein VFR97_13265 [Capillimicrobium sp.]|nr:hypothetical protein [Capillimicrobium sp.]